MYAKQKDIEPIETWKKPERTLIRKTWIPLDTRSWDIFVYKTVREGFYQQIEDDTS